MERQNSLEINYNNITATEALDMEPLANETGPRAACVACHASCATCWGARDHQCLSCADDALLVNLTGSEPKAYCCPKAVVAQLAGAGLRHKVYVALGAAALALSALAACALGACLVRRHRGGVHRRSNVAYDKLAADEKQQSALELEREIHRALREHSGTDSDDEL